LKHVNDLLDVSKLEAGKMEINFTRTDLAELVRTTASMFESLAQTRSISYEVHTPEHLMTQVDVEKIDRIFLNLLSNAFKFSPDGSKISVSLNASAGNAT